MSMETYRSPPLKQACKAHLLVTGATDGHPSENLQNKEYKRLKCSTAQPFPEVYCMQNFCECLGAALRAPWGRL